MDFADLHTGRNNTPSTYRIQHPETIEEMVELIAYGDDRWWYLKNLISASTLPDNQKDELHSNLANGIQLQEAYELQKHLLFNQQQPGWDYNPRYLIEILWCIDELKAMDDWKEHKLLKDGK